MSERRPYIDYVLVAVAQSLPLQVLLGSFILLAAYIWHTSRTITTAPTEFSKLTQKPWSKEEIREAYRKVQTSPTDVRPYLFSQHNRRYIVVGGSGLVGGWIVQHLLMRGENPAAIRIIDLSEPTRKEVAEQNIVFLKADVSDAAAVSKAVNASWPKNVSALPLTVFHTVAYISPCDRKSDFLPIYVRVNIEGTRNVLKAAREAGASCFIATSSSSVGMKPPAFFPWPWQRWPKNLCQFLPNAERENLDDPLHEFGSCYSWSKAQAEQLVRSANDPRAKFLTGCIRPGHSIYGHGVQNTSSITYDYLRRGGSPSWIPTCVVNFVNAQNVSIGHLAYENAVLKNSDLGGRAYCVTDPSPPTRYGELYKVLTTLAHPLTPIAFPYVSHLPMLIMAYMIETYIIIRHRYFPALPPVTGDIAYIQPAMFNMCTLHVVYTDTKAKEEIGYRGPIETLEGFAAAVADWNKKWETLSKEKIQAGRADEVELQEGAAMPKGPNIH
ncbi:hypothetical protein H2198_007390 [Neophaeococcomyces mojaviensis]|uniref:Uncharacterized protein n=1 Tax=Neophaeococcomyces mojaviensis TaxID=3383035 RepID=A0ACC3A0M5_9EURO|nr:hypothetical protein H2198_007390 [Knufia sp. JES_112]